MKKTALISVLAIIFANTAFAQGAAPLKPELMKLQAIIINNEAFGAASLTLANSAKEVTFTCLPNSLSSLEIKSADKVNRFTAQDFYSFGCRSLLRNLIQLGAKVGDAVHFRFYGPEIYPGLILGLQSGGANLVFTPAGTEDSGTFEIAE